MFNKPGKTPLQSGTYTGNRIDSVIAKIDGFECVKTNLMENEADNVQDAGWIWHSKNPTDYGDIIVLLGAFVQKYFDYGPPGRKYIRVLHPSAWLARKMTTTYVEMIVETVLKNAKI